MPITTLETHNEQETKDFAVSCAKEAKPNDIFLLEGDLGVGKSVFARAFIQYLAQEEIDVPSPTFTLLQTYDLPHTELWHFDLYRLKQAEEIYELGWEDCVGENLLLIEWPQKLESLRPRHFKEIIIEAIGPQSRKITYNQNTKQTS